VVTALLGCKGGDERQGVETPADIKQTVERVMTLAAEEPERALEVIDSFRTAGLPDYEAEWLRAKVYSTSPEAARIDSAIVIAERLMEQPVAKENREYREDVLETLVNASPTSGGCKRDLPRLTVYWPCLSLPSFGGIRGGLSTNWMPG